MAGDGGEEGSRGGSPGNESEAGWKVSGRPRPSSAAHNGSFPGIGAGKSGAPGLGLGAAGESVQAVSCAPGGTGCSRAGSGDTGITRRADFPSRPSSASSVPWLERAWAAQGTWGGVGVVRAGCVAPRGLECRGARSRSCRANFSGGKIVLSAVVLKVNVSLLQGCDSRMHANFFPWWWRWWGDNLGSVFEDFSFSAS